MKSTITDSVAFGSRILLSTNEGLKLFLGEGRAHLLQCLLVPSTTGQLAQQLGVTAGAASQHLTQLKKIGVIESYRRGRHVFYRLNDAGHSLLKVFEGA